MLWLWSVNTSNLHYKTPTQSQCRVSCQRARRALLSADKQSSCCLPLFQVLLYYLESPCIHRSQRNCHTLIRFLPLRDLALEKDLPTSCRRGMGITLWTWLAVPHALGRNHPQPPACGATSSPAHLELPFRTALIAAGFPSVLKITQN